MPKTYLIVGASRGIGLAFVRQLLKRGDFVLAAARDPASAHLLQALSTSSTEDRLHILQCDITSSTSITDMVNSLRSLMSNGTLKSHFDNVIVNAGVLKYPNRATELSFDDFEYHLRTNTVGPIILAQKLLAVEAEGGMDIGTIVFVSSDSGSAARFREMEDGFAAYAASKAALNQMLRHMAAELKRQGRRTVILAIHPGEVATEMANVELGWEVQGVITPDESTMMMLPVIESKTTKDSGTFWTWQGEEYPW